MTLEDFGYNNIFEKFRLDNDLGSFEIGRVIAEHKERYIVKTIKSEFESEITGNMRFTARSREDFPAVGDWVVLTVYDADFAVIHKILPRFSILKRQAVGQFGEVQVIAANIDFAFVVQAVDRDFNINRLERYLTIDMIVGLSENCKFIDCTHTNEIGCCVLEAVEKGEIDEASYQNYLKMEREKAHFESTVADRRKKDKVFGKILKNYKKDINKQ